jgi:dTDP-4-amino-4,6-dideoxy-D-galactose acyltransferase
MRDVLEILPWDTNLLGYTVGRLHPGSTALEEVAAVVAEARRQRVRLLYWFVEPDDLQAAHTAQGLGARLVDRKITYTLVVPEPGSKGLPAGIEPTVELTPALSSLALQSGPYSRFQTDVEFAADVYAKLYTRWIENSVAKTLAREVLIYRPQPGASPLGLVTLGLKISRVDIGLLAVDEKARGQAIGGKLIEAACQRTIAWGSTTLQVVTQQDNTKACRFYERCGFQPELIQHVYHIWLK